MSRVVKIEDHGMWRGRHSWTITFEHESGRSQVSAHGETEAEALANATETFTNRRIFTKEEKAALSRTNEYLKRRLR